MRSCEHIALQIRGYVDKYDLDDNNTQTGLYGINIHRATGRAGKTSTRVDKWSAGCQVLNNPKDFARLIDLCKASGLKEFTYTLLREF